MKQLNIFGFIRLHETVTHALEYLDSFVITDCETFCVACPYDC